MVLTVFVFPKYIVWACNETTTMQKYKLHSSYVTFSHYLTLQCAKYDVIREVSFECNCYNDCLLCVQLLKNFSVCVVPYDSTRNLSLRFPFMHSLKFVAVCYQILRKCVSIDALIGVSK